MIFAEIMNLEDQYEFKFDSRLIGKRSGQIIQEKKNSSFDGFIDFESVNYNPETSEVRRHINEENSLFLNILNEAEEDKTTEKEEKKVWKYFEKCAE